MHKGLDNKSLYDGSKFSGYSICLDTGKIATEACSKDVRGGAHTSFAYCYREDIKGTACNQHVMVDYCTTGGGVATEYCSKFVKEFEEKVEFSEKALVKLTRGTIELADEKKLQGLADT